MTASLKLLLVITSLMIIAEVVTGDYQIGWSFREYSSNPNNTLASGDCCETDCSSCSPVLRFCFRDSGHSHQDINSSCSLQTSVRNNAMTFVVLPNTAPVTLGLFTGSFQLYIRVAHDGNQPPMFDTSDPLIDNVFFEFTGLQLMAAEVQSQTGDFNRVTIEVSVNVICADGFNGSDCNTFCESTEGILSCRDKIEILATTTEEGAMTTVSNNDTSTTADSSPTVPASQSSDNTVAIAVGVSIALIIVLLLILVVIIGAIILNRRFHVGPNTAFYTVKRAGSLTSASSRLSNRIDNNVRSDNQPVKLEEMYSTVNKKSEKAPKLPPPYNPDDTAAEYQNINKNSTGQNQEGALYANTTVNGNQKRSDSLMYADVAVSSPNSHINQDTASDDDGISYSELQQQ